MAPDSGDTGGSPDRDYQAVVGALLYAAMCTRPDIAFAVQQLSRHLQATTAAHWTVAKRVLRYLQGTKALGITYHSSADRDTPTVYGYSDSDWGGDLDTRRSTTGYVFMLGGAVISWSSRLQPTVALSSTEAEYMAVCSAGQEAVHLRQLLTGLQFAPTSPTVIFEDNQGCIALSENPVHHQRTKHIDIRFHYTRDLVACGDIKLKYIPTADQLADLLTKALPAPRTQGLTCRLLGLPTV